MITDLLDDFLEVIDDQRNRKNMELWDQKKSMRRPVHANVPRPLKEIQSKVPFTVELMPAFWAKILKFSMIDYYKDPVVYLEFYLRSTLYKYRELQDNIPVRNYIPFWIECATVPSLFGVEPIFSADQSPWNRGEAIIKNPSDLDLLKTPDFYKDGLMPQIHCMYKELKKMVGKDIEIGFPYWDTGPFGSAIPLRGATNILIDLIDKPEFIHKLMRFVTDARKKWYLQRSEFLGNPMPKAYIADDDVNSPTISPKMFEEFLMPYEKEISEYQGGLSYWHSCGDVAGLISSITKVGRTDMQHVSKCSDIKIIAKACPGIPLEICLDPTDDVLLATKDKMKQKIEQTIETCKEANVETYIISTGGLVPFRSAEEDIRQLKLWISVAESICNK